MLIIKIDCRVPAQSDHGARKHEIEKVLPQKLRKHELHAQPHDKKQGKGYHHPQSVRQRLSVITYHPCEEVELSHTVIIAHKKAVGQVKAVSVICIQYVTTCK